MLRRSVLFTPGDDEHKIAKALASSADAVVLDLEDAVAAPAKDAARALVMAALTPGGRPAGELVLRVNRADRGWDGDDARLAAALSTEGRLDGVMLPKVESADDLDTFLTMVGATVPLWPVATETAAGVQNLAVIAGHPAVTVICWGAEDLSAAIGAWGARLPDGSLQPAFQWVRSRVLFAAKAAGVDVLDTVYVDLDDDDGLRREAGEAAAMGFTGKMALHPRQAAVIQDAFRPPRELVERAERLLAARAAQPGVGTIRFEGQMVDEPHVRLAEQILQQSAERD